MALDPSASPDPAPDVRVTDVRVTDDERQATAELLADAAGAGLLALTEADERLATVYRSRTAAELAAVSADLPPGWLADRRQAREVARGQRDAQQSLRRHVGAYLAGMVVMLGIWLVVGLSAGGWYPWPIWPALGWGMAVRAHVRTASGRPRSGGCGGWKVARAERA